jgi:hypothetical protein
MWAWMCAICVSISSETSSPASARFSRGCVASMQIRSISFVNGEEVD